MRNRIRIPAAIYFACNLPSALIADHFNGDLGKVSNRLLILRLFLCGRLP